MNTRKNMHSERGKISFKNIMGFSTLFLWSFMVLFMCFSYNSKAAEELTITCDGEKLSASTAYAMHSKQTTLILGSGDNPIYADKNKYEVRWSIETGKEIAGIAEGSEQIYGVVTAKSPGEVTVLATVYNKVGDQVGTTIGSVTCRIRIEFSIDTSTNDNVFKKPFANSTQRAIFMRVGDAAEQLSLNYGSAADAQWTIGNEEIATVSDSGLVTPVGSGHTVITATYNSGQSDSEATYTNTLDVYIYPKVSETNSNFERIKEVGMNSGESIYVDCNFSSNIESIQNKMVWVIKKEDGSGGEEIIADSLGKTSDLIKISSVSSRDNKLSVQGKAGKYYVYFYPKAAYTSENDHIADDVFAPAVMTLSIYADFNDYAVTIPIQSTYDIAAAFNLTKEEYMTYFTTTLSSNAGNASNYATLTDNIVTAIAKNSGKTTIVTANATVKDAYKNVVADLINPDNISLADRMQFKVDITIADVFSLDQTYTTVYSGQKFNLNAFINGDSIAPTEITWKSSDSAYVSVSSTGEVNPLKVTSEDITITALYNDSLGTEFSAQCQVKVVATADNMKISQDTAELNVGESVVVSVASSPEVAYPPYQWYISDDKCISCTLTADNKTATLTAIAAPDDGKVINVTVVNPLNKKQVVCTVKINVPYEELSLTESSVSFKKGQSHQLYTSFKPANVTRKELIWTSMDTSIVTVDEYGTLLAKEPGITYVDVTPKYNPNGIYARCMVTVLSGCESMTISETDITLNVKEERIMKVTLLPKGCDTNLSWNFTDTEGIASVTYDEETNQAVLTGNKGGKTILFVKSSDGPSWQINVNVLQPCTGLSFSPGTYELMSGEKYTPGLKKTPEDTTDAITWSSYDTSIASVSTSGVITGGKTGTTHILARSESGQTAILQIVVKEGVSEVKLKKDNLSLDVGQEYTLEPEISPDVAYDKTMSWTSSNSSVVSITPVGDSNLKIKALKGGYSLIKGVSNSNGHVVTCMVYVNEKATSVTIKPKSKILAKGKKFRITATVSEGATNKGIKWTTSNKKIATVSKSGLVKGKKVGTAYITATAKDGSKAKARCKVKVVKKVKKIKLSRYTMKLYVGKTKRIKATIKPKNATIKGVKWSSADKSIATVDGTGRVTGVAPGVVRIKATAKDGSGKKKTCVVNVVEEIHATGVEAADAEIIIPVGGKAQSGITATPNNTTDSLSFYSDNKKVASVNSKGRIKGKKAGQATIYGRASNGQEAHVDVWVVEMNRKTLTLRVYDTETLSVDEIADGVTWYSSNPSVASVDTAGKVVGRKRGVTTIYAKIKGVRVSCRVTVTGL